jgi:hypothetical protein
MLVISANPTSSWHHFVVLFSTYFSSSSASQLTTHLSNQPWPRSLLELKFFEYFLKQHLGLCFSPQAFREDRADFLDRSYREFADLSQSSPTMMWTTGGRVTCSRRSAAALTSSMAPRYSPNAPTMLSLFTGQENEEQH